MGLLVSSVAVFGQVGINIDIPQATLDVREKDPANATAFAGIAIPQINSIPTVAGNRVGQIVYVLSDNQYYYYNGLTPAVTAGWVPFSSSGAPLEPWNIQGTTTPASLNSQNIYQTGSVAVGKNAVQAGVALDVQGAVRFGDSHTGTAGINSAVLGGSGSEASADNAISGGSNNKSTGQSAVSFGLNNTAAGNSSVSMGLSNQANGVGSFTMGFGNIASSQYEVVVGRYNAIHTGTSGAAVATDAVFQIGNGTAPGARGNSMTVLKNGSTGIGIAGTEATAKPTERLDIGTGNVRVRDINTNISIISSDKPVVADATGVLKTINNPLFHARLAANQAQTAGTVSTLLFATPIATSALYTYNTSTGTLTFNQAGNYLITLQASFGNLAAEGTQLVLGVRPVPDANYLARGSHYSAAVTGAGVGELMNYTTVFIVPSVGYQIRFTTAPNANCTVLSTETGGSGSGNVTNVTVQKI